MNAEAITGAIWARDHYRYVRLYYATRLVLVVLVLLMFSILGNLFLFSQPTLYRYVMTKPTGELMPLVPIDRPNMTDEQILTWTVDAVTRIHTFDFRNYRAQFQANQDKMSVTGWEWYLEALNASGNFKSITANKYVTTAVPTGPATVISQGVKNLGGVRRYVWTVEFPMVVTYRSSQRTTNQDLKVRVEVGRLPEYSASSGVAVRQILAR